MRSKLAPDATSFRDRYLFARRGKQLRRLGAMLARASSSLKATKAAAIRFTSLSRSVTAYRT